MQQNLIVLLLIMCIIGEIVSVLGEAFDVMLGGGQQAALGLVNIEWSYESYGTKITCDQETSRKIELAYSKDEPTVCVSLHEEVFVIDVMTKTGRGQQSGELITLSRKWLGSSTDNSAGY